MSDSGSDWKDPYRVSDEVWRVMITNRIDRIEQKQKDEEETLNRINAQATKFFEDYSILLKEMLEQKARRQKFYADAMQRCAVLGIWAAIIFLLNAAYMSVKAYLKQ